MQQHASSPEPDIVTTLGWCCVSCTGFLFGGEWNSNSPAWCARHCEVKCLRTWLRISISSPKATDDPFGLPLITCAVPRTHNSFGDRSFVVPVREFGTVCRGPCGLWTLDISYRHFKTLLITERICFTRLRHFVTVYISALEIILLTYLLTYLLHGLNVWIVLWYSI